MKTSITKLATVLILGAVIAATAAAAVSSSDVHRSVNSAIGAEMLDGVDRVIDLTTKPR